MPQRVECCGIAIGIDNMDHAKRVKHEDDVPKADRTRGRDWQGVAERQILEAMERGDFDNLAGRGKPLDLSSPPHTPPESEIAFKLLRDAGFAPEWIEQDKEIRAAKAAILKPFENYLRRTKADRKDRSAIESRLIADFRKQALELNRLIDDFNLKAPSLSVHHTRIRIEEEIYRFGAAALHGRE